MPRKLKKCVRCHEEGKPYCYINDGGKVKCLYYNISLKDYKNLSFAELEAKYK